MANYTNTIEFKAKDAQIKSAVDKLAKSLGVIDKLVDGINGKFVKGLRGSVGAISKELKTTVKVANDLSKAFSSAQKQSKKVNVEISKTERGLLKALRAVKSQGGAVSVSKKPDWGPNFEVKNKGVIDAQNNLKEFMQQAAKADRVFSSNELGLTKQIAGFKGLAASINVSKTAIKGKTEEYKLFMNAVRGQAIAEQNLLRIERERIAARKSLIVGEGLGLTAGPGGTFESIKDILGREDQMGNTLADINLYKSELEEALQFIERGTEEYLQTEAAIERINVDLNKVTKKERERKNELKESGKIIRNMIKDLGKLGGRGIKEFLGVLGGKRGMLPQLAGGAVGLQGIKDMVKFVPFLDKKLKAQVRTYAELGQKATTVLGGIKLASIGLSGALGATTWVVDAIKGFVQFEDAAFETFHRIQGGMDKTFSFFARFARELPQLMSSAMMVMPQAFGGAGGKGSIFDFMAEGSAAQKVMEGGQWTLERKERARFARQGPTKLQGLQEELDWQRRLATDRNSSSKDFMQIQKKILQLELRIRKEEANRLKTRKKLNGVVSEELQIEARKALAAQRTAAIAEDDRFALMAQRETDSVEFRGRRVSRGGWRRFQQMKKNRKERRERLNEGLMLGAGFPVLFGGGLGAVGGGVAGAVLQSKMGPGKGFGAQILLSAVGQQLDAMFSAVMTRTKELAAALDDPINNIQVLIKALGQTGTEFGNTISSLEKMGLKAQAGEIVLQKFNDQFGKLTTKSLSEVNKEQKELTNQLNILGTSISILVSGPLSNFIKKINEGITGPQSDIDQVFHFFKDGDGSRLPQTRIRMQERFKEITGHDVQKWIDKEIPKNILESDEFKKNVRTFLDTHLDPNGSTKRAESDAAEARAKKAVADARAFELSIQKDQLEIEKLSLTARGEDLDVMAKEITLRETKNEILKKEGERKFALTQGKEERAAELQHEIDLLNIKKERNEVELEHAQILANPVKAAIVDLEKELNKLNDVQFQIVELSGAISSSFSESFKGIIQGTMSVQEAFANMFSRIADHFLDMAARMAAAQLQQGILKMFMPSVASSFAGGFSAGGLGSKMGSGFYSGANTGGLSFSDAIKIGGKAAGGPVSGGSPYIVGEKGPELFVPGSSGNIVPNHAMGGANVVVNVDASGSSVEGDAGQAEQLGSMLAAAVQAEIANQQRPGGLLANR